MDFRLSHEQEAARAAFRLFVDTQVAACAEQCDRDELVPSKLIEAMCERGYLGSIVPREMGGQGWDMLTYGLLHEEIGRCSAAIRSLITVHDMVAQTVLRWGTDFHREQWLEKLTRGEVIAAFAVSEPNIGSDLSTVETSARSCGDDEFVLNGTKNWISFAQIADLFLILTRCEGKPTAFLVERDRPGLSVKPQEGLLGLRGSMLGQVTLNNCYVPRRNLIGRQGFALFSVIPTALGLGRFSVAWGCVGIAQACLETSLDYTSRRKQFGMLLKEHQLIKQMISRMATNVKAARLLCSQVAYLKDAGDPLEISETFVAKYFASRTAMQAAADAVQIQGAYGCTSSAAVQRYFRDAKVMEIIEGSTQIQEITIADSCYQERGRMAAG